MLKVACWAICAISIYFQNIDRNKLESVVYINATEVEIFGSEYEKKLLHPSIDFLYSTYVWRSFSQNEFFLILWAKNLQFGSTYIHQTFQFYSYLYSEGFNRGVCSYIIYSLIYITFYSYKQGENVFFFYSCWQYFLIYGLIKRDIQNSLCKNLWLWYVNKMKQEFWSWLYPMLRFMFWKCMQIIPYLIR